MMLRLAIILLNMLFSFSAFAYTPPIGIPDPGSYWSTVHPIDTANPDTTTHCPGWHEETPRANSISAEDERNCYYIDNVTGCTDSSNVYGYPGHPRCTVPASNPSSAAHGAGTYFEIYGGEGRTAYTWTPNFGEGTGASPIWVVGKDDPKFSGTVLIGNYATVATVSYVIMDGLYLTGRLKINLPADDINYSNICFRNGTIAQEASGQGNAISVGTDQSSFLTWTNAHATDVVIYKNDIGPIGDKSYSHEEFCGVFVGPQTLRLFVLDNDIHDSVEDGVAGGHGGYRTSSYIYIGRNEFYDSMTNAIDFKHLSNVIISENDIAAYRNTDESDRYVLDEGVVVLHYAGDTPGSGTNERYKNYPENVWFIFNTVHDADYGLVNSTVENVYLVGNVFYNIHHDTINPAVVCQDNGIPNKCCTGSGTGTSCPESWTAGMYSTGAAIHSRGVRGNTYIANNTVYDSDGGIVVMSDTLPAYSAETTYYRAYAVSYNGKNYYCINDSDGVGISNIAPSNASYWAQSTFHITDNIVSARAEATFYDYALSGVVVLTDFDRNLVYNSSASYIYWGADTQRNMAYVHDNSAFCGADSDTCYEGDPLFKNPATLDFSLQSESPAIGKAVDPSGAYSLFNTNYSISIEKDIVGTTRPQQTTWDIGAYEYYPSPYSNHSFSGGATHSFGAGSTITWQ